MIFGVASNKVFSLVEPLLIAYDESIFPIGESNLTEPDSFWGDPLSAWVSGATYAIGDRVTYLHRIYTRLTAGAGTTAPPSDDTNWVYESPTNAWKMFDTSNTTQTKAHGADSSGITFKLHFPAGTTFDTVVFDSLDQGASIRLKTWDSTESTVLDDQTVTLYQYDANHLWAKRRTAVFLDLPNDVDGTILEVTMATYFVDDPLGPDYSSPRIGTMVVGSNRELGVAQSGFGVGINDRSVKSEDAFGNATVVERSFSKRMSGIVAVPNALVDAVVNLLAQYRATPAMFLATGADYGSMVMYAFYKSFDVAVTDGDASYCSIDIEGLT